jgi:hypothetical protein
MRRVRIAAASFALAAGLLGAMTGTATAEKPSTLTFGKVNADFTCAWRIVSSIGANGSNHWDHIYNPSLVNQYWRTSDCDNPPLVHAGAVR